MAALASDGCAQTAIRVEAAPELRKTVVVKPLAAERSFTDASETTALQQLRLPDAWQQEAVRALQEGLSVVVDAPTGAGKTYIFELLIASGWRGRAVYTVPTRALANDKLLEWRARGWRVGITTGDLTEDPDAPVVVATLETQRRGVLEGQGPDLLVVDEYQMLGDDQRGRNYELVMALAPPTTQLLLLSGSVGNPKVVSDWFERLGRSVRVVRHAHRPVPLQEVALELLPDHLPPSVQGLWPEAIGRALQAGLAPLLAFAPRRRAAENLAHDLARMLPEHEPLELTRAQKALAGPRLAKLLKARIAFHHSGLDYRQRAGLIEPLAKAGQLRIVVATMGLAAGINFSLRTVVVTDRAYRTRDGKQLVQPHELLQMFGRAGRRGMDKTGYALAVPGKPRWSEAQPLRLQPDPRIDWPSFLSVLDEAARHGQPADQAASSLARKLFAPRVRLDLHATLARAKAPEPVRKTARGARVQEVVEFQDPDGNWCRRRSPRRALLGDCLSSWRGRWCPAIQVAAYFEGLSIGRVCKLRLDDGGWCYGREWPVARLGRGEHEGELVLTRPCLARLQEHGLLTVSRNVRAGAVRRSGWQLNTLEPRIAQLAPRLLKGLRLFGLDLVGETLVARFDLRALAVLALEDPAGRFLLDAPERRVALEADLRLETDAPAARQSHTERAAEAWLKLGLIDLKGRPTRRGILCSFFHHGEGLALAAALEDASYPTEELVFDSANIRAGHRFTAPDTYEGRLGRICLATYGAVSYPGYLHRGLPPEYGDGAAEVFAALHHAQLRKADLLSDELLSGDLERARLEWRSLLTQIAHGPDLDWDRWLELRLRARELVYSLPEPRHLLDFPPLTAAQRQRHKSFLSF